MATPRLLLSVAAALLFGLCGDWAAADTASTADPVLLSQRLRQLAGTVQALPDTGSGITRDVGSIAIVEHDGSNYDMNTPDGVPNYGARAPVARRFYQMHGDFYDFIVVFTNFPFDTGDAQAFYNLVRNDVRGIGRPLGDSGALFGSPGRLKGYIDMADLNRWRQPGSVYSLRPGEPGFLTTLNVLAHELGHQWLADARYQDASGQISSDLLGKDGAHWSYLLDSDASVMYGSDWARQEDGRYVATRTAASYSALDLYLMGLLDPGRLPPFTLLRNPAVDPKETPVLDAEVYAVPETITVQQIAAAMGARVPDYRASPKELRLGFVFLTRPGTEPEPEDLAAVETIRQYFAAHFFALTRGVAVADTNLTESVADQPGPAPDLDRAVEWLLAQQTTAGNWQDASSTAVRDTAVVLEAFAAIGRTDAAYQQGLAWLDGADPRSVDFTARRAGVLALTATSAAARARLLQKVLSDQGLDGGFGFLAGFESDALDTALALRALSRLKQPGGSTTRKALAVLAAQQLPTGGWPMVAGGDTSTVVTAEVLLSLQDWAALPEAQALFAPGLTALLARRNADGGFGESPSTSYGTALALQVLSRAAAPPDIVDGAVAWLQARQLSDGSWDASPYATALVLGALRGGASPNLTVPADGLTFTPDSPVKEGVTVRVAARVRNVGRRPSTTTQARLYEGAPGAGLAVADAEVPQLEPGAQAAIEFDLPTTDRPGTRTFFVVADPDGVVSEAREDDNAVSRALTIDGLLADLVIGTGDLAVSPYPPEEGETVEVSVAVTNRGDSASAPSLVRVVRGNPRAGGVLLGQAQLPSLGVAQAAVVTLPWNTAGQLGTHTLYAVADAAYSVFELDENNNETALMVRVTGAQSPGVDLEVALVALDPPTLRTLPAVVAVSAVVRNLGRDPVTSAVALHVDGAPVGELPTALGARSTTTVAFSLHVPTPGDRALVVRADPAGTVSETDESNNEAAIVLVDPQNTVDLEIGPDDVPVPSAVVAGQPLLVTALVHNRGTAPVTNVPVVLRQQGHLGDLARTTVTLAPGTAAPVTLTWTTSFTGEAIPLVVTVDPFGLLAELSEENNSVNLSVQILPSALTNLRTDGMDIRFDPDPPLEGEAAMVSTVVRNTSPVAAGPFTVRFYRGDPAQGGTPIGETALAALAAMTSTTVAVRWAPVNARGTQGVFVVVDALEEVSEYDETDNRAFRPFSALALPDLALTAGQVVLDPRYPRAGESVTVRATVRNVGQQPSPAAVLRVFSGEPASGQEIGSAPIPVVPPGGAAVVELSWEPAAPLGEKTLSVLADADNVVPEVDEGNNLARLQVLVQDADLFLTEAYFSPDGDGVRDHTLLGYRATARVNVIVSNRLGRKVRTVAQDAPASGSLLWDGTDDRGRLQPDGAYTFSLEGQHGAVLGRVQAFIDTNRESIHDAAGTALLAIRNLSCDLPDYLEGPVFMPGEDEVLFIVNASFEPQPFPIGLLRVGLDGQYDFVARNPWFAGDTTFASPRAVSPDGREVLIRKNDALYAVDLLTGLPREVAAADWNTRNATWSPDGRWIATSAHVLAKDGSVVTELPMPSSSSWAWSPDSQWLALGNVLARRDGSATRTVPGVPGQSFQVLDTVWRGDGKIVAWISGCGEGCGGFTADAQSFRATAFVIDPDAETASELGWLRDEFNDETDRTPIGWSSDGSRLLYAFDRADKGTSVSRVAHEDGSSSVQLLPHAVSMSPRGSAVWYGGAADSERVCLGGFDRFAAFSLQNLTVAMRPSRLPANNGVLVTGTVSDRHLGHYQLEYAPSSDPASWRPIGAASEVPVFDDTLTVWVPPSPGTYLLRLRAEDRAGNVRTRTSVVAWDRVPLLANITQTEFLISPNEDGTKDAVTFNYLVVEPTRAEVRIVGPQRAVTGESSTPAVRRFSLDHPEVGAASFVWDGRNEDGVVVPDGRYTVLISELPFRVHVDATPPDIAWSYEHLRVEKGRLVADRLSRVVDTGLKEWVIPGWFEGRERVYEPMRDADGEILYADGVPRMLIVGAAPVSQSALVPVGTPRPTHNEVYGLATDPAAALIADDFAGNRSTLSILPVEEKIVLVRAGTYDGPLSGEDLHKLQPTTLFKLAETIRETPDDGETIRFQFQPREGGVWTEAPPFAVNGESDWVAPFEELGLSLGGEYRGRFVTNARGRAFATQEFLFRPCTEALGLRLELMPGGVSPTTALWELGLTADVPERLVSATLTITGLGKLAGYRVVRPFDLAQENHVFTPLPSCAHDPPSMLQFEVRVTGESGRVYEHDDHCRMLERFSEFCSSLHLEQSFAYCSGSPDAIAIRAEAMSVAPDAIARLYRGPTDPPKDVSEFDVGFNLATPTVHRVIEDVTGLPEGTVELGGVLGNAESPSTVTTELQAIIDRTAPAVEFLAPPEGGQLCVTSDPATGLDRASFAAQVDDAGPQAEFAFAELEHLGGPLMGQRTELLMACAAPGPNDPVSYPPACGNGGHSPAFPRILTGVSAHLGWNVTGLPDGDYAMQATFCDRSGNRTLAGRRLSLRREPPRLKVLDLLPAFFSPNGDGAADEVTVKLRVTHAVKLRIDVQGVRRLLDDATVPAGDHSYTWDGRTQDGTVAPDGAYSLVFLATDGCGRTAALTAQVTLDNTPPTAVIAVPMAGQMVGVAADVRGIADDLHFAAYEMSFGAGPDPGEWAVVGGLASFAGPVRATDPPGRLVRWDTPAAAGLYTLRLVARDAALNHTEARVTVEVRPRVYLGRVSATPDLFSPNGDGRRESSSIEYELMSIARVSLEVTDAAPAPTRVRILEAGIEHAAGQYTFVWDGTAENGTPAADGEYRVRIRVEDPGGATAPQEEWIPVVIDRLPPAITVDSPVADGFAARNDNVRGAIEDHRLSQYVVTAFPATADEPVELRRGTRSPDDRNLGPLALLTDGRYTLIVRAEDAAENRATADVPFIVDATPPAVSMGQPTAGAVLDSLGPALAVTGTAVDEHLLRYTLGFGPGSDPAYFTEVASAATGGVSAPLGLWSLKGLADGPYTLRLEAVDRAGLRGEERRAVVVDGTRPQAQIDTPAEGACVKAGDVAGTAADANLESWRIEFAPGAAASAALWSPVGEGSVDILDGPLVRWNPMPPDGVYTLRLTVKDRAGHTSVALRTVTVDRTPPAAPTGFAAKVERASDTAALVTLNWNANQEPDVATYRVARDDEELTPALLTTLAYLDAGRPEGRYRYSVEAVDRAGNVGPRAEVTAMVDLTAPLVDILRPRAGTAVSGSVEIRGTAYSTDDFREYRLFVGTSADPASLTLLRRSTIPVAAGPLGNWTAVGTGERVFVLEAEDLAGNQARVIAPVVIDNDPPAPPTLTSVTNVPDPSSLTAAWQVSPSPDVSGYLVYRNGRVANAAGLVIDLLRGFLVPGPSYVDSELPDGEHCYRLVAMDGADNVSVLSNELCGALDNRPPSAQILQPPDGTRFDYPLRVIAFSPDLDVASVQFQLRGEDDPTWRDLGGPDTATPYEKTLDPTPLGFGIYALRVVATDRGGRIDPNPAAIEVTYGDATPPRRPEGLATRVDGADVSLTWNATDEVDVAGYHVFRDGERVTTDAVGTPSFVDAGREPGSYSYQVTAADGEGNESVPSEPAHALVFTITLDPPSFPVTMTPLASLTGSGAPIGSTVHVLRGDEVVGEGLGVSDPFLVSDIVLAEGPNLLRARATDPAGNRSLPSDEVVVISNAPPAGVTSLSAALNGYEVDLAWSAVLDPEVHGYVVDRGDTALTASSLQRESSSVEASHLWFDHSIGDYRAPEHAFDGNPATAWIAPPGASLPEWTVTFPKIVLVDGVRLRFATVAGGAFLEAPVSSYRIEARWEGRFIPLVIARNNASGAVQHALPMAFATDALRIVVTGLEPQPGIAEVDVSKVDVVPAGTSALRDTAPDGVFVYRVAAVDRYGARGIAAATELAVGDVTAPLAPTGLVALAEGSDVVLTWNANPEPDVSHYVVTRDGLRIASTPVPVHRDLTRSNGTYVYRVIAVDGAGNESAASDPVPATVDVQPPIAPVLQGTAGGLGEILLTWEHAGAADYEVHRSLSAGGPYALLAHTGGARHYTDATARLGITHYYIVRALDTSQNLSPRSNEVALTTVRTAPLAAPDILFPTDAAHPIVLETARSPVQGRAPPSSLVQLDVNGTLVGMTETRPAWAERDAIVVPGASNFVISLNGQTVAYTVGDVSGTQLHARDVTSGATRQVPQAPGTVFAPTLSPDGRRLAYVAADNSQFPYTADLFAMDLAEGTVTPLENGPQTPESGVWSPDGTRFAYVGVSSSWPYATTLVVRELLTGTDHVLASAGSYGELRSPAWSPDGTRLAFTGPGTQIFVVDVSSGAQTAVTPGADAAWSPDGRTLTYVSTSGASQKILVRNLDNGGIQEVSDGTREVSSPAFDTTGERVSYIELRAVARDEMEAELVIRELTTGRRISVEARPGEDNILNVEPATWLADGRLAVSYYALPRLGLFEAEEGFFELPDVALPAGVSVLVARALDLASGTESSDSAPVEITVAESLFPDLAVSESEMALHPVGSVKGQRTTVSAVVRNVGGAGVADVRAQLTVFDPSGVAVVDQEATLSDLDPGSAATVFAIWTPATAGGHRIRVRVDAQGVIDELREDNNGYLREVEVAPAEGLLARIASDRGLYQARAPVQLEVVIANTGETMQGQARTTVEDASGREVSVIDIRPVALAYGGQQRFTLPWNTGTTYAGDYAFRVRVDAESGTVLATADQAFRIAAHVAIDARLQAVRSAVVEGAPASFVSLVENTGVNAALADVRAHFRVLREGSDDTVFEQERALPLLLPGGLWEGHFVWPSALPTGSYRASLTVVWAGQALATSQAPFQVSAGSTAFAGTLSLHPADVLQGGVAEARLTVSNRGAGAVAGLAVAVEVRDGARAALIQRQALSLDLLAGETRSAVVPLAGVPMGSYPVLLRAGGAATTLARATLRVHGPITPPTIDMPAGGARVASPHPELRVNNALSLEGAPLAYEFQLFADAALTVALPGATGVAETTNVTGWRVPTRLTEDATYFWRARATDGFSSTSWTAVSSFVVDERNEPPSAPVPDQPEPGARVASREPTLVVTNALDPELDPLTYEFRLATDPDLTAVIASTSGVPQGAAFAEWRVPLSLDENETYYWNARAWDGSSYSPWSATVSFIVDTLDESPTVPVPLRPIGGAHVMLLRPELVVANAADPEGRPLNYRFEIDVVPTFDSPAMQASGDVGETEVETAWTPSSSLLDDTTYYWRAAAGDGRTVGPWAEARFSVNLANDPPGAPVLLDPADLQVVTTSTPTLRVRNAVDVDGDALTYEFEVTDEEGAAVAWESGIAEGAIETIWTVPVALRESGLFTWRARARDPTANGGWSTPWRFRVNAVQEPPTTPTLVAPAEGAILDAPRVTLVVSNAFSPDGSALTYTFEIYRVEAGGGLILLDSMSGLAEGHETTSWVVSSDLADGAYSWRARAHDSRQAGPWMASAHFRIALDAPPAPPAGLTAIPGDGEITLQWNANREPDVTGYRVYRSDVPGGPYAAIGTVATPGIVDRGRANGVTVYYVVTATDARFESVESAEVAATPQGQDTVAEVRFWPDRVAGECLFEADHDDDDNDDHDDDGRGGEQDCPRWMYATAELPRGLEPASIDRATVRLAGAVTPDTGYDRIVDLDGDGIRERKLRFPFAHVVPHLRLGRNTLSLTGRVAGVTFHGTGTVDVLALAVDLRFTPRTLAKGSAGTTVQARVTFRGRVRARDVAITSLRLNDALPIARVVSTEGSSLTVKFDRAAVAAMLPLGDQVSVRVSGIARGVPFVARDQIRVIE